MRQIINKRIRYFFVLCIAAGTIGGIAWWQLHDIKQTYANRVAKLEADSVLMNTGLSFGDFSTQSVDDYIYNLRQKLSGLDLQDQAYELQLQHPDFFPRLDISAVALKQQQLKTVQDRYKLDAGFMGISMTDYRLLGLHLESLEMMRQSLQMLTSIFFNLNQTVRDPLNKHPNEYYVRQGDIIGLEGCTGVCNGTHVHFMVYDNGTVSDPCDYLPNRDLSRWGVDENCGVKSPKVGWPLLIPWIVSQNFADISPVTGDHHEALDIIDREFAPVIASTDGWYHSWLRSCARGVICNDKAARIVYICSEQNCDKGIRTEYWHLDWMVNDDPLLMIPRH